MCIIMPANATSFTIGLVAHGRVNKDGPRVRGVLIPAEPASKSGRARHNSSFARLAGITVTYFLSPFSSFSPNFISRVCRCLVLYSLVLYSKHLHGFVFRRAEYFTPPISPLVCETKKGEVAEINGNTTCLNNYSLNAATLFGPDRRE